MAGSSVPHIAKFFLLVSLLRLSDCASEEKTELHAWLRADRHIPDNPGVGMEHALASAR
jgi:hypothetical protein